MRRNGVPFYWQKEQDDAFKQLKSIISSEPIVQPYSLEKEVTLTCDACDLAISAILSQEGMPVVYVSRLLTGAEKNYATIEKEALALVWAVKRLEKFLLGRRFTIKSDHRALMFMFDPSKTLPKHASARLQRWAISLMNYDYEIMYEPGKNIPHVDALNRLQFDDVSCDLENNFDFEEPGDVCWIDDIGVTWRDLVVETTRDKFLRKIKQRIISGNWQGCSNTI